jgi:electron transfer flavoprotein alpha subunit
MTSLKMTSLLIAEHDDSTLSEQTARALTAALQLGGDVDILVAGHGVAGVAEEVSKLQGIRKVLLVDVPACAGGIAEPIAALLSTMASDYEAFLAPASARGRSILPRFAALIDVQPISDIVEILSHDTFKKPIYAGNALQVIQSHDGPKVLTLRASSFRPASAGTSAPIHALSLPALPQVSRVLASQISEQTRPELVGAKTVVSGGRALGSSEQFNALILPIADKLGGAIGASRAAVDAGFAPNDWQVGQTGKIVAPELYIAAGISGAIQHLAGMKDSRIIVAINSDPDAPIFRVADFGLVGDVFKILPELAGCL